MPSIVGSGIIMAWGALTLMISGALIYVSLKLWSERHRHEFEMIAARETETALATISYETEVMAMDESGFFQKKTTLHIRERVLYKDIRLAEWDRTVVVKREVSLENLTTVLTQASKTIDSVTRLVLAVKSQPGAEILLAPGVRERLGRKGAS